MRTRRRALLLDVGVSPPVGKGVGGAVDPPVGRLGLQHHDVVGFSRVKGEGVNY